MVIILRPVERMEYNLFILYMISNEKRILKKLYVLSYGLYYTYIRVIETYATMNLKLIDPYLFAIWHNRLGHPGSIIMRIIIENSHGHPLKKQKIPQSNEFTCDVCFL